MEKKNLYRFYPLPDFTELPKTIRSKMESGENLDSFFNNNTDYNSLCSATKKLFSLYNLIFHRKIHLSNISTFNDPTESIFYIEKELAESLGFAIKTENLIVNTPNDKVVHLDIAKDFVSKCMGIACFTKKMDSPVMWGTVYGNNHNSICVKFKAKSESLVEALNEEPTQDSSKRNLFINWADGNVLAEHSIWGNMVYAPDINENGEGIDWLTQEHYKNKTLPHYNNYDINYRMRVTPIASVLYDRLFRKHIDWQPESEIRYINKGVQGDVIVSNDLDTESSLNDLEISGIIFGENVDESLKKYFSSRLRDSDMSIEKAVIWPAKRSMGVMAFED